VRGSGGRSQSRRTAQPLRLHTTPKSKHILRCQASVGGSKEQAKPRPRVVKLCNTCWNPNVSPQWLHVPAAKWPKRCGSPTQPINCGFCATPMSEHSAVCKPSEEQKQGLREQRQQQLQQADGQQPSGVLQLQQADGQQPGGVLWSAAAG